MRIIGLLACFLQLDERFGEPADLHRKDPQRPMLLTCATDLSGLKRAVHLLPFRAARAGAGEQVRSGGGQTVEQGVVRRADRAAQVGLRGLRRAGFREAAGGLYQVERCHGYASLSG